MKADIRDPDIKQSLVFPGGGRKVNIKGKKRGKKKKKGGRV
jgi:hypothetical protein